MTMEYMLSHAALFPGPGADDELECPGAAAPMPARPRRGLPRTGSVHTALHRGHRQVDHKSRFLSLAQAGKPKCEEALEEVSSDDEGWEMDDCCLVQPMLDSPLSVHAAQRPGPYGGATQDMHLDEQTGCAAVMGSSFARLPHVLPLQSQSLPSSPLTAHPRRASRTRPNERARANNSLAGRAPAEVRKRAADTDDLEGMRHHFKRFAISAHLTTSTLPVGPLPERV